MKPILDPPAVGAITPKRRRGIAFVSKGSRRPVAGLQAEQDQPCGSIHPELAGQIGLLGDVGVEFPARVANTPTGLARLVDNEIRRLKPIIEARNAYID